MQASQTTDEKVELRIIYYQELQLAKNCPRQLLQLVRKQVRRWSESVSVKETNAYGKHTIVMNLKDSLTCFVCAR